MVTYKYTNKLKAASIAEFRKFMSNVMTSTQWLSDVFINKCFYTSYGKDFVYKVEVELTPMQLEIFLQPLVNFSGIKSSAIREEVFTALAWAYNEKREDLLPSFYYTSKGTYTDCLGGVEVNQSVVKSLLLKIRKEYKIENSILTSKSLEVEAIKRKEVAQAKNDLNGVNEQIRLLKNQLSKLYTQKRCLEQIIKK